MELRVGLARKDITPALPFPLGGVVVPGGRKARWLHDRLFARVAAFADGTRTVVLVTADLLAFHKDFREAIEVALRQRGVTWDGLLLAATHTHSAVGGYWNAFTPKLFMGAYRQDLFDHLVAGITEAVAAAVDDLQPATLSLGETEAPGLSWNRRHPDGPLDRHLRVLLVDREKDGRHRIVTFGAHPVVGCMRAPEAVTADYPGALVTALEAQHGGHALFVNGAVGGVNIVFPEPITDLDDHLALVRDALLVRVADAEERATPLVFDGVGVAATTVYRQLALQAPPLFPSRWRLADAAFLPLRWLWKQAFLSRGVGKAPVAPVTVLRIGDAIIAGFPADMGPGVSLAVLEEAKAAGLRLVVAASHANDFVGYVHEPETYELPLVKGEDYRHLSIYENAMGACGREVGAGFVEQLREALAVLA